MTTVTVHDAIIYYLGDGFWTILSLISILILLFRQRPSGRIRIILWAFFSVIILYNPISLKVITKAVEPLTYYRFFWILPGGIIITLALISLAYSLSNRFLSGMLVAAFFVFLSQAAVSFVSLPSFEIPSNAYELGNDIFQIEEAISNDKKTDMPVVAMPSPVQMEYRTYDAAVSSAIRKEVYQGMVKKEYTYTGKNKRRKAEYALGALLDGYRLIDSDEARKSLSVLGADYAISPRNGDIYQVLTDAGCVELVTTDSYVIYTCVAN